jgi:peptidoglycan LD-endopeptidase LytH
VDVAEACWLKQQMPPGSTRIDSMSLLRFRPETAAGFHPVMKFGTNPFVFDFTEGYDPVFVREHSPGVGRYNEERGPGMYVSPIYSDGRNVHMGIDLWDEAGRPVFAFSDGVIFATAFHDNPRDYGPTIVTRHEIESRTLYVLHGHLSRADLGRWTAGDAFRAGEVIGHLGTEQENGDWVPHVHIQLSLDAPERADMPGVVHRDDRLQAQVRYPDPRLILGPIY